MNTELANFLQRHEAIMTEAAVWANGLMPLSITSYLGQELPPLSFVTSVRAIVIQNDQVLVIRDPEGYHILPGGRREANESLLQTLQRELQEESGWSLSDIKLIGFKYFHQLNPHPSTSHVGPDFLQVIYTGRPEAFHPDAREQNGYELEAIFRPRTELATLKLNESDLAFLEAALQIHAHS